MSRVAKPNDDSDADSVQYFALLPRLLVDISPFKGAKRAIVVFEETLAYFEELLELKRKQIALGETEKGTMDLMGGHSSNPSIIL